MMLLTKLKFRKGSCLIAQLPFLYFKEKGRVHKSVTGKQRNKEMLLRLFTGKEKLWNLKKYLLEKRMVL